MRSKTHHKAVVISAVFTAFLLAGAVGGLAMVNRLSATTVDAAAANTAVVQPQAGGTVQVTEDRAASTDAALAQANAALQQAAADLAGRDAVIAAYDAQLREAYTALQQAYAQIEQLQAAQSRFNLGREQEHERGEHMIVSGNQGVIRND
ncbi:MAG: hypothetical protein R2844_03350 [Caldilineales bacterium]